MAEEYSAGTLSADLTVDTTGLNKGVDEAGRKLDELGHHAEGAAESLEVIKHAAERMQLERYFDIAKEAAQECIQAFDANNAALRTMTALTGDVNAEHFKELAESLSAVSRNSVATEMSAVSMASKFGLTNTSIGQLLPRVNDFAAAMHQSLPDAVTRFSIAIASGEASTRRLGLNLGEEGRAAFKAGDENQRVAIIMQALGRYAGQSAADVKTAAGAQAQMHNASEELYSSIGKLIDAPMAAIFTAMADAVKLAQAGIDAINPTVKEFLGYALVLGGGAVTAGLGLSSMIAGFKTVAPLIGPVITAVASLRTQFLSLLGPLLLIPAAMAAVATAYGSIRNAMEGKFGNGVLDGLKLGFERAVADAKAQLNGFLGDVTSKTKEAQEEITNEGGGSGIGKAAVAPVETLDFGKQKDITDSLADAFGSLDFSDAGGGAFAKRDDMGPLASEVENVSSAFDSLQNDMDLYGDHVDILTKFTQGLTDSFDKTTDANADLFEAQMKAKDEVLTGQALAISQAGGVFTEAFAGITQDMTQAERNAALAGASPGAQAGGMAANALASAGGTAGQVAGGLVSGAMGNPAGFAQAGLALLEQSKSFQTIMMLINKTLSVLVQAINPLLNAVIPALTVVLSIVGDVVKNIIKVLTPLMAPIMKLVTTIMLILKPFIEIWMQLQTILVPILTKLIVPVFNALSAALMFLAKIIIDGIVNPLIEAWDAIIDAIDDVLGWLGVDLSSLKMHTISLEDDSDAVDSVTDSMNQLDQSSQNIPEGYKVALSAFNAYGGAAPSTQSNPIQNAVDSLLGHFTSQSTAVQSAQNATNFMGQYNQAHGTNVTLLNSAANMAYTSAAQAYSEGDTSAATQSAAQIAQYIQDHASGSKSMTGTAKFALPASSAVTNASSSMSSNNSVVVQSVTVQATTSDLIAEMTKALKNQGYLKSGTNMMGATQRTQYGAA